VAIFVGGPCDGLGVGNQTGATAKCAGVIYERGTGGNYYPPTDAGGAIGVDALGTRGPRGWADVQRAVGVSLPTGLSRAGTLTRAARRKLVQRHRMR